jgi:GT2 family glycosyltransferase
VLTYSAVIATKDRPERLEDAVGTVLDQDQRPERVVIVDASGPPLEIPRPLADQARLSGVELTIIHSQPSTSAQRNLGVELVDTPLVLFLDDDVTLEPSYTSALLRRWELAGLGSYGAMVGSPQVLRPQPRALGLMRRALMLHYYDFAGKATRVRRSGKLALVPNPDRDVIIPAVGAGGALFRTDLARRHPFDERFSGYAPGEDLEMSYRLSREAPILQTPSVKFLHAWDPRERESASRWRLRGRCETSFRLSHLGRSPVDRVAFAVSVAAETILAGLDSLRERDSVHLTGYVGGVRQAICEQRRHGRRREGEPGSSAGCDGTAGGPGSGRRS